MTDFFFFYDTFVSYGSKGSVYSNTAHGRRSSIVCLKPPGKENLSGEDKKKKKMLQKVINALTPMLENVT